MPRRRIGAGHPGALVNTARGSVRKPDGLYGSDMDPETIAAIVLRGTLAEWHRLRDAAAADSAVLARLLSACKARGRLPDFQENAEPFRCWLAYAESVMARDVDGTVLQEVYADARGFYSPT